MDVTPQPEGFIVKRRGAIGNARADFMCNSATCRTKKGARVYELPAASVKCPVCSKKLVKLMSAPNISRGIAKRSDAKMEPEYTRQQQNKDRAREQQRVAPMLAVDPKKYGGLSGAVSAAMGMPVQIAGSPGAAKPTPGITSPDLAGIKAAGAVRVPRQVVGQWQPKADEVAAARRGA